MISCLEDVLVTQLFFNNMGELAAQIVAQNWDMQSRGLKSSPYRPLGFDEAIQGVDNCTTT